MAVLFQAEPVWQQNKGSGNGNRKGTGDQDHADGVMSSKRNAATAFRACRSISMRPFLHDFLHQFKIGGSYFPKLVL